MPAPLTPADSDLQDFPFMPLQVARLRDSDLAAEEEPEACWYAVLLWAASWHQLPAGSLPNNDAVLTKLIGLGRDLKTFRKHKDGALRGFVLCDDGRLYHGVVAEQVNAAWDGKLQQRWRSECARVKKANQRSGGDQPLPSYEEFLATLPATSRPLNVPRDNEARPEGHNGPSPGTGGGCPPGNDVQERETGTGRSSSDPDGSGDKPPPDPKKQAWDVALKVLMDRGRYNRQGAAQLVGKWSKQHPAERILKVATAAWEAGTLDPVSYITAALTRIDGEETDPMRNPEDWRQRRWMAEFVEGQFQWNPERGPEPGKPGCRISPEIQREFGVEPAKPQALRGAA